MSHDPGVEGLTNLLREQETSDQTERSADHTHDTQGTSSQQPQQEEEIDVDVTRLAADQGGDGDGDDSPFEDPHVRLSRVINGRRWSLLAYWLVYLIPLALLITSFVIGVNSYGLPCEENLALWLIVNCSVICIFLVLSLVAACIMFSSADRRTGKFQDTAS